MIENEINLYFFDWFKNYSEEHNLEYPFSNKEIYPLEKVTSTWKTMNNEIIEFEYHALQAIKLQPSTDLEIEASPYKDIRIKDRQVETKDIKKLHHKLIILIQF